MHLWRHDWRCFGCLLRIQIDNSIGNIKIRYINGYKAMKMPGGGTFKGILPGQYTDDNELAYHLLVGLNTFDEKKDFHFQK